MYIIKKMIEHNENMEYMFVEYIISTNLLNKLKRTLSKTGDTIVDWLIEYKADNIIKLLMEADVFSIQNKYKIMEYRNKQRVTFSYVTI